MLDSSLDHPNWTSKWTWHPLDINIYIYIYVLIYTYCIHIIYILYLYIESTENQWIRVNFSIAFHIASLVRSAEADQFYVVLRKATTLPLCRGHVFGARGSWKRYGRDEKTMGGIEPNKYQYIPMVEWCLMLWYIWWCFSCAWMAFDGDSSWFLSQMLNVGNIQLHLPQKITQMKVNIPYMEHLGMV